VLGIELPWLDDVVRAKRPQHLPVVMMRAGARVLGRLDGVPRRMAILLYGAGLRRLECCRLRIQDDFESNELVIRDGKGRKDRVTILPAAVKAAPWPPTLRRARAARNRPSGRRLGRAAWSPRAQVPERRP
jgi:integrase